MECTSFPYGGMFLMQYLLKVLIQNIFAKSLDSKHLIQNEKTQKAQKDEKLVFQKNR